MNNKGQAVVEAMIFAGLAIFFSIKLVQFGLDIRYEILFDDLIERTLICHFQKQTNCASLLREKLTDLHFTNIQISEASDEKTTRLTLSVTTRIKTVFNRESEMTLDLSP
ncbi:MAG: hypothetical protein H7256_01735 [Bdellovibrio sp.]|nr:hypothetical protein [Bdellovibrio sp.]